MKTHLMFSCSDSILLRVRVQMWGFTLWLFCCISPNIYFSHIIQSSSLLPKHLHTFNGGNRKLHYILSLIDCSGMAWRFKIETTGWRVVSGYTFRDTWQFPHQGAYTHTHRHTYTQRCHRLRLPWHWRRSGLHFRIMLTLAKGKPWPFGVKFVFYREAIQLFS